MTNKNIFQKSKSRLFSILLLCLVCIFSFSMAVACSDEGDDTPNYDPSFEYTEHVPESEAEALIKNGNFTQGLVEVEDDEYPVSSMTGWSISADTGASSSAVTSGVIDLNKWSDVVKKLTGDTDFVGYAKATYTDLGVADNDTTAQIATKIEAKLAKPEVRTGATDNNVLMLNNISASNKVPGYGTAQYALSTSQITLEAGEQARISVWVNTDANLSSINSECGANIRLLTTVNGVTQAQYAVKNIKTDGIWKEYTIYVNGNQYLSSTITVALGLGISDKSGDSSQYAYGIAYFDDLSAKIVSDVDFSTVTKTNFSQSVETYSDDPEAYRVNASSDSEFYYDLSYNLRNLIADGGIFNNSTKFSSYVDFAPTGKLGASTDNADNGIDITVDKTVYGAISKESFEVKNQGFAVISFTLTNNLNKYYKDGVKVYVQDMATGAKSQKALLFTDNNNDGEETVYTITINNNFPKDVNSTKREFQIIVIVGPQNPDEQTSNTFYPVGTVSISSPYIYQSEEKELENKKPNYEFLESLSSGSYENFISYNLYAGQGEDYTDKTEEANYNVKVSGVNNYNISNEVVHPSEYKGVTPGHKLLTKSDDPSIKTQINTLKTAGVINSKYVDKYTNLPGIGDLVENTSTKDEHTQSLVIYNVAGATPYGFVGATKTLSANSTVKVTLNIKTTAIAYIYLVDMSSDNMFDVLSLEVGEAKKNLMLKVNAGYDGEITFNVASGASAKNYRLEIWHGERDGETTDEGFVIVNDITFGTFTEATAKKDIYGENTNALALAYKDGIITEADVDNGITDKRDLTDLEKQFNEEYKDDSSVAQVKYDEKYVWVATEGTFVYAIYNTVDPVTSNPYDNIETEEETEEESGCNADFNAGTFWLQFSTIALAVLLVVAVLLLIIRTLRRNHKKTVKVKSRYSVRSRNVTRKVEDVKTENTIENYNESVNDVTNEEPVEDETEYTYGEVLEDFGDDVVIDGETVEIETTEEVSEEVSETPATETVEETSNENE